MPVWLSGTPIVSYTKLQILDKREYLSETAAKVTVPDAESRIRVRSGPVRSVQCVKVDHLILDKGP